MVKLKTYKTRAKHLLTGNLVNPDGQTFLGNGNYYRLGTKAVKAECVKGVVLHKLADDLKSDAFVSALVKETRNAASKTNDGGEYEKTNKDIRAIATKIEKLTNMLT